MELKQHGSAAENQQPHNNVSQESCHFTLHQKQPQDDVQQGQTEQAPLTTTVTQISERNTISISETNKIKKPETECQYFKVQKMGNQQSMSVEQPGNLEGQGIQVPFGLLLPALHSQLDKDKQMQLQTLYDRLRKNEIAKEQFVRLMTNVVGEQVLRIVLVKFHSQLPPGSNQTQLPSQAFARQENARMPFSAIAFSVVQVHTDSSYPSQKVECQPDSHATQVSQIPSSRVSIVKQEKEASSVSVPAHVKQQQPVHFQQTSFPMCGSKSGTYNPYSETNDNTSGSSMKVQARDFQMQILQKTVGASQIGGSTHAIKMINVPKFERQNSVTDPSRVYSGSISQYKNRSASQQNSNREQSSASFSSINHIKQPGEQATEQQQRSQLANPQYLSVFPVERGHAVPGNMKDESLKKQSSKVGFSTPTGIVPSNSVSPSTATRLDSNVQVGSWIPSAAASAGPNTRTSPKKPFIGQKKPLEALGSFPPPSSKKQKVAGAFLDQSIEQLNDVTAVSGVNLREEEEQLLSGSKEDNRVSEASRRVVQEEEERLILQKTPLQKKLAEIMAICCVKNINKDVERCLSLCVEERMRGLISSLIRLSSQRVDAEKPRHKTIITSDVQERIVTMNRKVREEWEKKQAEAEKSQKVIEPEGDSGVEGDKKDEGRVKAVKANKAEDDTMRTMAANVAAQAAVGGVDTLSKWQLWAEQARQKHEGGVEATSGPQSAKDVSRKHLPMTGRNVKDNQQPEKMNPASRAVRKFGRNQEIVQQIRVARTVSIKDVIAVLEREPQMSKSTLLYRLYERVLSDAPTE